MGDWMHDIAEAVAIANRIGERVVVIGTSTGATLATLAAHGPLAETLDGLVLISPNFRVKNPAAALLTWPSARWWLPRLAGTNRSFEPRNAAHGQYWTLSYPSTALFPMAASVLAARRLSHDEINVPALFIFDDADQVVDHTVTRAVASSWGGPAKIEAVQVGIDSDPYAHVIAGDILSPGMTDDLSQRVTDWIRTLP